MSEQADEGDEEAIEAAARMLAFGAPLSRAYFGVVADLVEARGGWIDGVATAASEAVIQATLDEIFARANELQRELAAEVNGAILRDTAAAIRATKH